MSIIISIIALIISIINLILNFIRYWKQIEIVINTCRISKINNKYFYICNIQIINFSKIPISIKGISCNESNVPSKPYLVAEYNNEPLSAAIAILHVKTVTYLYGASSNEKRNLMPNYLMQFNMIEWAINNECTKYDFGGVFNTTMDNGLYRFKEGFCGEEGCITYIGEIDKVYKKLYYIIYNKAFPIVEHIILKKIKK